MDLVTGALGGLISNIGQLLKDEYKLQRGVPEQIRALIKELECAHAALRKVGRVPPDQLKDEQLKLWAREIREASYDMEDVLDDFLVGNEGDLEHSDNGSLLQRLKEKMARLYSMVVSGTVKRRKIAVTIDDINERINEVTQRYGRYTIDSITLAGPASTSTVDPRLAAMYKEVSQLIGINKSSSDLISMLSPQGDDESKKKMKMVSIVGVGGLGKTTLAKAVYDKLKGGVDGYTVSAFVPVGREPDLKKVFRDVLIELDKKKYLDPKMTILDERQLINEIREYLKDKSYFIVIDDVWDTKSWETIKLALDENKNGSSLITTTRISDVAIQAGEVYKLKPLPSDQSKKLFYTRIFGADRTCPDSQLDEVSEKILKKCDGVPLAIITMASLLVDKSREEWIEVCTSVFRDKGNKQVSDTEWILSLNYNDLPTHLKTCLLYLSAFPEDYQIEKKPLIWKWVAEGFLHGRPGTSLFEVGEGYFNELVNRSMIMATEIDGRVCGCRVHDMVLDLLRVKSQEENFVTISGTNAEGTSSPITIHRLAYQNRTVEQTHLDTQMDLLRVRTFIASSCRIVDSGLSFMSFKLLRVLALEDCSDYWQENRPVHLKHIGSLLFLRYLGLRRMWIRELPEVGALKLLQTLDLSRISVEELPYSVCLLTQLIYLGAGDAKVPNGVIERLTSLEYLQIRVSEDTVGKFVKDLGKLRELRELLVEIDSNSTNAYVESDLVESLGNLHKIRHLSLFLPGLCVAKDAWDRAVLPRPLQSLDLTNWSSALPSYINPSGLPNLSRLTLMVKNLDEQGLKILSGLPELRYLHLCTDSTVTLSIHAADDCFQQLTYLMVPDSMPLFALNEDSSVSLTIWNLEDDVTFGSKTRDKCIVAPAVMQNLKRLLFAVRVQALIRNNCSCENLGLEHLPSFKEILVDFRGYGASDDDVEKEKAALRQAIEAHPNRPYLRVY